MREQPNPPLEYQRPSSWTPSRRSYRVLLGLTILNTLLLSWFIAGPPLKQQVIDQWNRIQEARRQRDLTRQMLAAQQQCLTHLDPPDRVVYEENPQRAAALKAEAGYVGSSIEGGGPQFPVVAPVPTYADAYVRIGAKAAEARGPFDSHPFGPPRGALFLHERNTTAGEVRLVAVAVALHISPPLSVPAERRTYERVLVAAATPMRLRLENRPHWKYSYLQLPAADRTFVASTESDKLDVLDGWLRLFAGQPDPSDPSRFTISYEVDDQRGTIEGRVEDDDVMLTVLDGPLYGQVEVVPHFP